MKFKYTLFYSLLFLVMGIFLYFTIPFIRITDTKNSFKNYTTVALKNDDTYVKTLKKIRLIYKTIDDSNQIVKINNIDRILKINKNDISKYLLDIDPRINIYIKSIENIFYSKNKKYKLVFFKKIKNFSEYKKLQNILELNSTKYFILDKFDMSNLVLIVSVYSLSILLFVFSKKGRFLNLSIGVFLNYLISKLGILIFLLSISLYLNFFVYIDKLVVYKKEGFGDFFRRFFLLNFILSLNFFLISINLALFEIKFLIYFIFVFCIICLFLFIYYKLVLTTTISQSFEYGVRKIDISSKKLKKLLKDDKNNNVVFFLPIFVLFGLAPLILFFVAKNETKIDDELPYISKDFYTSFDYKSVNKDYDLFLQNKLPNLGTYILSLAYEQGFLYNRKFEKLEDREKISMPVFNINLGNIQIKENTMLVFDKKWIENSLKNIDKSSFLNLFFGKNVYYHPVYKKIKDGFFYNKISFYLNCSSIFIFFIIFFGISIGIKNKKEQKEKEEELKEKS